MESPDRVAKLWAIHDAAKALYAVEWGYLLQNYDTGKGDGAENLKKESPEDYERWEALRKSLEAL